MKIEKDQTYKLTEFQGGLAIVPIGTQVKMPHAQDLIAADRDALAEYLATYLSHREAGRVPRDAHELALAACKIQKVVRVS